jgi:hypothetical protein
MLRRPRGLRLAAVAEDHEEAWWSVRCARAAAVSDA